MREGGLKVLFKERLSENELHGSFGATSRFLQK